MRRAALSLALLVTLPAAARAQVHTIVIDPGHGGKDPGGTGNGMEEKSIVLDVSDRFRALLELDTQQTGAGGTWDVLLTRSDDTFVSLAARSSYANSQGADRFMSIHSNAFGDPQANGTETFSYPSSTTGAELRNLVQEEMIRAWGLRDRGNKTASFSVLRETAMPAVLHELAFITNAADAQKLASPEAHQEAAEAHLIALQRHYGLTPFVPSDAPPDGEEPPPDDSPPDEDPPPDVEGRDAVRAGCQATGRSPTGLGGLALVAISLLLRRRKRPA